MPSLLAHRADMFTAMGVEGDHQQLQQSFADWLHVRLPSEQYLAWVATVHTDSIVGGIGVGLMPYPPSPLSGLRLRPIIYNLYVEPAHRRRGLARALLRTAVEWCTTQGYHKVSLHASSEGRSLYEAEGFAATTEMARQLKGA